MSGLGVVGPHGLGAGTLAAALAGGAPPPTREVDRNERYHRPGSARRAILVGGHDLAPLLPPTGRRMSAPARYAVAAARLALEDAGLTGGDLGATAIVSGTAWGPTRVTEQLLLQIFGAGPETASPALFTESVASAAASQVAIAFRLRGPNVAINQRAASGLLALGEAMRLVASGRAERALAIAVDESIPILHAMLDRFGALARANGDGVERARPFDRRRAGMLVSEGATVALVEPIETIVRRGARPRLELVAAASGFDPSAPPYDHGTGSGALAERLARELGRQGIDPAALALVVSGASGSRRGDRLEAGLLRALFAPRGLPPVIAPKWLTGEYGGDFLGAALLAAAGAPVAPPPDTFEPDPELGIAPAAVPVLAAGPTLVTTCAAGGAAAWIVAAPNRA